MWKKIPYETYGKRTIKEIIRIGDEEIIEEFELKRREASTYIDGIEAIISNKNCEYDIEKATMTGYYEGLILAKSGKAIRINSLNVLTRLSEECIMLMGVIEYRDGKIGLIDVKCKIVE